MRTFTHEDVASGLTFLGLQAMMDPPRSGVDKAFYDCYKAGVRIKMITGDGNRKPTRGRLGAG